MKIRARETIKSDPFLSAIFALISDTAVYLIGAVLLGLGNFLLIPIFTRFLTPAEFGVFALLEITVMILVTVSQLGFGVSYLKWFAEFGASRRGELLGSTISVSGSVAFISGSLLFSFVSGPIGENWLQIEDLTFAWTLIPIVVFETMQLLLLSDLRAQRKPIAYVSSTVLRFVVMLASSYWLIVIQQLGLTGVFLGRMIGDAAGIILLASICLRCSRLRVSVELTPPMIRYGMPILWSALIALLLDATGRYFLNHYSTSEQVGYYAASIKVAGVFQILITQPFGIAWGGMMFQIAKWSNAREVYSKILAYVFLLSLSMALIIAVFTPTFFNFLTTPIYAPAMAIFPLVLLVRAINILEYPVSISLYLSNQTRWFVLIYAVGLFVNIIMSLWLVPDYGLFGSSWAWLSAWITIIGMMAIIGKQYYPLVYNPKFIILPLFVWCLVLVLGYNEYFSNINIWFSLGTSFVIICAVSVFFVTDYFRARHNLMVRKTSQLNK